MLLLLMMGKNSESEDDHRRAYEQQFFRSISNETLFWMNPIEQICAENNEGENIPVFDPEEPDEEMVEVIASGIVCSSSECDQIPDSEEE